MTGAVVSMTRMMKSRVAMLPWASTLWP